MRLGIISALPDEQKGLIEAMGGPARLTHGMRDYSLGQLWGIEAVCVVSRIGKVAAAMAATVLVEKFEVTHIIFTGVAGAGDAKVRVGDVVIAEALVQHDMDCRPQFPKFEVPLTGQSHFKPDPELSNVLGQAADDFFDIDFSSVIQSKDRREFKLEWPRVHRGLVASGDQFISNRAHLAQLGASLPGLLAVEMEGAAVAQVCFELGVPFAGIRTISESANEDAGNNFLRFVKSVASLYALHIIHRFCVDMKAKAPSR
ncbi:5'-methylthioadenosine/adenosylhomocysteine nucleosidase [Massilia glaciei]|uniref:adenosylhomocysteine nucleosidase n=2 Tax=Massilia glaciei TaxID=1524097 RepID=A0A2U2I792_9BURK|nr:5'-methylthioadenosine/adenosylhomocysteine nucleosidase [Massilia glaciei]